MYGKVLQVPQTEKTPFYPRSPYGVAKVYAHWITVNYREAYKIFACNGILFNHESPRRGGTFVTKKIVNGLCRVKLNMQKTLYLGNLESKRDWGHAKDYVKMMWMILQYNKAEDWVIATGTTTKIRDFVILAFKHVGIEIEFKGSGINEKAFVLNCKNKNFNLEVGKEILSVDPRYFRPTEVDLLVGDASKAKNILGWEPELNLQDLVDDMMSSDLDLMKKHKYLNDGGYNTLNYFE